jgi:excisionase family DNA binding protein
LGVRRRRSSASSAGGIVDAADVARALGLHRSTVAGWIRRGVLRGHRLGDVRSRLRVRLRDVRALLRSRRALGRGILRMVAQSTALEDGERQRPSAWRRQWPDGAKKVPRRLPQTPVADDSHQGPPGCGRDP